MRSIWQNFWSITGAILAILGTLSFISFQVIEMIAPTSNPYVGIWTFMALPAVIVVGLLLIPLGYVLERNRRRRLQPDVRQWAGLPQFDLNKRQHLRILGIFVFGTLIVAPLIGIATYEGYHYTDSTQFCGQVCHTVMRPEFAAYQNSPHARVACAACHIGPGAQWYVKAKISGVRQVIAVALNTFSRPIPTPVTNLRPARETCEQCHWPAKFYASQLRSRVHFLSDEKNTRTEIQVLLKTGGGDTSAGPASGIHWHMALTREIKYWASDTARQEIPWVQSRDPSGTITVYRSDGKSGTEPPQNEQRTLDCMDCHNRPTHQILPPDRAVNMSMDAGRLDRHIPYLKKVAVEALTLPYGSDPEADQGIDNYIRTFYKGLNPATAAESAVSQTVAEVRAIYHRNFFPSMKVDWRAYPDNIGHMMFDGCFRCHDGKHVDSQGHAISKECSSCHVFLEPAGGQSQMYRQGIPEHPIKLEGIHAELRCSQCHTGGHAPDKTCAGCHTTQSSFRQGKLPKLPGLQETPPSLMAGLECEQCHDLSKPQTADKVAAQCAACHDKTYGSNIGTWQNDAAASLAKARAAIDDVEKKAGAGSSADPQLKAVIARMREALAQVEKAGPQHNLDLTNAVVEQAIKMAQGGGKPSDGK